MSHQTMKQTRQQNAAPLRLAIIGVGHLGRIHARLARSLPEFQLVAVVDPVVANRETIATENETRAVASHSELQGQIDCAVVVTPTKYHYEVAHQLLEQGVHVLVEKPMTLNASDADELIQTAEKSHRVLQVGHVERFNPAFLAGRNEVSNPQLIEATRAAPYSFRSTDVSVVLDLMIHDIDLALALADSEVRRVDAVGGKVIGPNEDWAQARIAFGSGAVASLFASRVQTVAQRVMQVYGEHGILRFDFQEKSASITRPSEEIRRGAIDVNRLSPAARETMKTELNTKHLVTHSLPVVQNNAILEELREFATAIRTGRAVSADGRVGREAVAVAEQVLSSITRSHSSSGLPNILPFMPVETPLTAARKRLAG